MAKKKEESCSFCGKTAPFMLQGMDGSFICPDCVELASRVLRDRNMSMRGRKGANPIDLNNVPKPQEIKIGRAHV